jgi:hypothetical protein
MPNQQGFLKITHNRVGRDPQEFIETITGRIRFELQDALKDAADDTADIMQEIIRTSGYKLDKLAAAIKATVVTDEGGMIINIGEVAGFPKGEDGKEYWNAFNDGWLPPPNWGYFTSGSGMSGDKTPPIAGASGQSWVHTGPGHGVYYMRPTKLIQPLRYSEIGYEALKAHMKTEIDRFLREANKGG